MKKLIFILALLIPSALMAATFDGTTFTKIDGVTVTKWDGMTVGGADVTPPTLSTSTIGTNGTTWTEAFSENVSVGAGGNAGWSGSCSTAGAITLTYSSGSGTSSLVYTGSPTVNSGDTCTISYTQPGNGIEDGAGNDLANITNAAVTNNSTQGTCADSSCTGFLVCQNFETPTTGYDNSETWTPTTTGSSTITPNDTTATVLRGTQQLRLVRSGGTCKLSKANFTTGQADVWVHFRIKVASIGTIIGTVFELQNSGTSNQAYLTILANGTIKGYHGASTVTSTEALTSGGAAHIWVHYVQGTGSNGTLSIYVGTTGTRPTAHTITNGTATGLISKPVFEPSADSTIYIDQVLVSSTEIGDVCD